MTEYFFAIPGELAAPTGGYAYARQVLAALPWLRHLPLPGGLPAPTAGALAETAAIFAGLPRDAVLLIDGLALGAFDAPTLAAIPGRFVALVHHPLCLESGIPAARAAALRDSEQAALRPAHAVIATSRHTAAALQRDFAVPAGRLHIAAPGTEPAPQARGTWNPLQLLAVGAISPRKGYGLLVQALASLPGPDWRLTIAGALDRDPAEAARLRAAIATAGLSGRVTLVGAVPDDALARLYDAADLFVIASLHEGYGMAVAAALAHGLPIVSTTAGALAETVPDGAGCKLPPGDVPALRAALQAMLTDPARRRGAAAIAWQAGQQLPRWDATCACIARVLRRRG